MKRKLYIIGNGFDIHHGLKTSYGDFHKWLQGQPDYSSYEEMECFFSEKDLWKNFEEGLGTLNYPEIVLQIAGEDVPSPAEDHYESRLSDAQAAVEDKLEDWRSYIQRGLAKWIRYVGTANISKKLDLDTDAYFLTFNYTKTLEDLYGIEEANILHIHGCAGESPERLVLGHGGAYPHTLSEVVCEPEIVDGQIDDPSYDTSYEMSKQFAYTAAETIVNSWAKPVDEIIRRNQETLMSFSLINEVVVLGLSFSNADKIYFDRLREIIPAAANWSVSWYSVEDKNRISAVLNNVEVRYFKMDALLCKQNAMEIDEL